MSRAWSSQPCVKRTRTPSDTPCRRLLIPRFRVRDPARAPECGHKRAAILGYYEDGPNLVTLAMNGWADAEPAWWLNLQAHPDAIVELKNGSRAVRARAAEGEERVRLWAKVRGYSGYGDNVDAYAALRSSETAVVVLEPRPESGP